MLRPFPSILLLGGSGRCAWRRGSGTTYRGRLAAPALHEGNGEQTGTVRGARRGGGQACFVYYLSEATFALPEVQHGGAGWVAQPALRGVARATAILIIDALEARVDDMQNAGRNPSYFHPFHTFQREAQMELRKKSDDAKIIAAIACLLVGMFFIWNIAAHITDIYELKLDADTCEQVKTRGLVPSTDCVVTAPFRPGLGATGYLLLSDGTHIQISPTAANQTNKTTEWSREMKGQFWIAMLFWGATLALLMSALREKK